MTTVSPELMRSTGGWALLNQPHCVVSSVAGRRCTFLPSGTGTICRFGSAGPIGGTAWVGGAAGAGCCCKCNQPSSLHGQLLCHVWEYLQQINSKSRAIPPLLAPLDHAPGSRLEVGLSSAQEQRITKHLRATAILAAVCRKVDRRHQVASASVPSLRLRKGKRLACRGRHAKDVEDHRYQRVVAEDAHELDGRSLAENVTHARERLIADAPCLVELLNEVVDRALVLGRRFWDAPLVEIADRLGFDARTLGHWHVGEPLVLRAPQLCRGQDGEFGEPRRHRGLEAT